MPYLYMLPIGSILLKQSNSDKIKLSFLDSLNVRSAHLSFDTFLL